MADLTPVTDTDWSIYGEDEYIGKMDTLDIYSIYTAKTCIQAKLSRTPPGHGTTRIATQLYQGILIDFSFSRMNYDASDQNIIYEGINVES